MNKLVATLLLVATLAHKQIGDSDEAQTIKASHEFSHLDQIINA